MKSALVLGGGGFIGTHLVERLKRDGFWVRVVDQTSPRFAPSAADQFIVGDLRDPVVCAVAVDRPFDELYQLAADMGGAGFIFTGMHDAEILSNSALVNLNVVRACCGKHIGRILFTSSACVYPAHNQVDPDAPDCAEDHAYPAAPDSEYGWEKLFAERLYLAHHRAGLLNVRVVRLHNVFGPYCEWRGGREKAPAALCRKVAEAPDGGEIDVWGDGRQTRSFLYVDECVEALRRVMDSDFTGPLNVGSDEMITIDGLVGMIAEVAGKRVAVRHMPGPQGVRGRTSDNTLVQERLGWRPTEPLIDGIVRTYAWVAAQVAGERNATAVGAGDR